MRRLRSTAFKILALLEFGCSVQKHAIQTNGINGDIKPPAWGTWTPSDRPHSPSPTTARALHALLNNYATTSPLVRMGRPKINPQNCLFPSTITTPSLDRPHSPSQTASGSNQPFCHNTLSGPTDRQTYRPTDKLGNRSVT